MPAMYRAHCTTHHASCIAATIIVTLARVCVVVTLPTTTTNGNTLVIPATTLVMGNHHGRLATIMATATTGLDLSRVTALQACSRWSKRISALALWACSSTVK